MLVHLKKHQVEFNQRIVQDKDLFQLFLIDPNGVKIELNFANTEAQDVLCASEIQGVPFAFKNNAHVHAVFDGALGI